MGTASTMKGSRHPTQAASRPAMRGPKKAPRALANRYTEKTRGREAMGNQSDMRELWVGRAVAWPTPDPDRMITSTQMKKASPVPNEKGRTPATRPASAAPGLRLSAIWAMGTVSESPSRAAAATSVRIPALVMWNDFWMFGIAARTSPGPSPRPC